MRRLLFLAVFVLSIGLALIKPVLALAVWIGGWVPASVLPVRWSPSKRLAGLRKNVEMTNVDQKRRSGR